MGKNSIERGSRDTWTNTPRHVIAAQAALAPAPGGRGGRGAAADAPAGDEGPAGGGGRGGRGGTMEDFKKLLRDPNMRDPRGYILPADQADFATATKFVNTLLKVGITVHGDGAVHRRRQELPGGLVRGEDRAGLPAARDGHVRAAGPSRRLPVSGRHADAVRTTTRAGRSPIRWA